MLQELCEKYEMFHSDHNKEIMEEAIKYKHKEIIQWLNKYIPITVECLFVAIRQNDLNTIIWIHDNFQLPLPHTISTSIVYGSRVIDIAANTGNLDIVEWFHVHYPTECTTRAMDFAACAGHFHVIEWLHANRREGCTYRAADHAAEWANLHNDYSIIKWFIKNYPEKSWWGYYQRGEREYIFPR